MKKLQATKRAKWMANSTNTFKRRLDTYWQDQEIIYGFHAQLQGTGSHSEVFRHN